MRGQCQGWGLIGWSCSELGDRSLSQWGLHVLRWVSREGGGSEGGGYLPWGEGVRPLGGYPGCSVGVEVGQEAWGAWLTPVLGGQWGSTSGWGWGKRPEGRGEGHGDGIKTGEGSVVRKFGGGRLRGREFGAKRWGKGSPAPPPSSPSLPSPGGGEEREGPRGPVEGTSPFRMEPSGEGA